MVSRPHLSVDPPDLDTVATVKGLARLWREQARLVIVGLSCAFVYTGLSLAIPIVVRHAIDNSIAPTNGHGDPLWPYLVAIVRLAVIRFGINFTRRYATSRTGIRVEWRMRELLYQAYLRYPRAFYDRHATGQVVSRATNDLYPIRYFIGWGMTQGLQSVMMIFGIAVVLFVVNPKLAAIALVSMPLVFVLAFMFARRVMPISRHVQQLKADVTEAADEAVVGIEMVQAFGREDDVEARFTTKAEAVRDGVLRQARVEAAFLPGLLFLPTISIAAVVLFGGRDVIGGTLTYGEFFLFYQLLLQLVWPLEALGWILSLAQRATASASRSFAWLRGIEPIPEPEHPHTLPAGPARHHLRERPLLVRHRERGSLWHRPGAAAGGDRGGVRSDRRRQVVAAQPGAAVLRPDRRTCAARRGRPARAPADGAALGSRARHAAPDPLLDPAPRQPDGCEAGRPVGRGRRRVRGRRASPTSPPSCPRATTR